MVEKELISKKLLESPRSCPSPACSSSDGFHIWEKNYGKSGNVIDGYCFVCGYVTKDPYKDFSKSANVSPVEGPATRTTSSNAHSPKRELSVEDGLAHPIRSIPDRGISYATAEYYGVRIGVSSTDGETPVYTLFPRHRAGAHIGWKKKVPGGTPPYLNYGGNEVELFGSHVVKPQGKKLYITEGEYDAMSVYQVLKEGSTYEGYNPAAVSLSSGAASALKSLSISSELLDGYDEIVLVLDNDEPGIKARDLICKSYAGKVSYVMIPPLYKDANDMLMAGKGTELKWLCLTHTKKYHPDGVVNGNNLWLRYKSSNNYQFYPWPSSMPILGQKTLGIQLGTIVTITSGTGSGKSQFLKETLLHLHNNTEEKIAGMFLEEDAGETVSSLMAIDLNQRINLPDVDVSPEAEEESFKRVFSSGRINLYDYFGGMDDNSLLSKLRYFAVTGHKFIFLDHLSIVVSEYAAEGGERERIDTLMTKLAKFVKEFNVTLFLVVHLRKSDLTRVSFELGAVPSLDDLRGSGTLKQLSWVVIALARNQQHENELAANTTELSVLKCRLTGRTGVADYLLFDQNTGRMISTEKPVNYRKTGR